MYTSANLGDPQTQLIKILCLYLIKRSPRTSSWLQWSCSRQTETPLEFRSEYREMNTTLLYKKYYYTSYNVLQTI